VATLSNITIGEDRMKTRCWYLVVGCLQRARSVSAASKGESQCVRGLAGDQEIIFRESFFLKTRETGTALGGIA
jgi:hypothetical protein